MNLIIFEGELLRYKPDNVAKEVFRWCVVYPTKLKYYKNKINSTKHPDKPLFTLPIKLIKSIERLKYSKDSNSEHVFRFEIKLSEEAEIKTKDQTEF